MLSRLPVAWTHWSPKTQGRLVRVAAALIFLMTIVASAFAMLKMQAMMHPPLHDKHHLYTPVHWGPLTLPSHAWQITWGIWLIHLFSPTCYCLALWSSGSLFAHAGDRDAFPPALARGLKHIAIWLLVGAVPSFLSFPGMALSFFAANGKKLHVLGAAKAALDIYFLNNAVGFVLALIGIVLLWAAAGGQKLRGRLDEFM